jgi:hypothetical protein
VPAVAESELVESATTEFAPPDTTPPVVAPTSTGSAATAAPDVVEPYGIASVEPSVVNWGDHIRIEPATEIQGLCLEFAIIYKLTETDPVEVGVLGRSGSWETFAAEPLPTLPACLPPVSSEPVTYVVPPLVSGTYILCLTGDVTVDGCGTFVRPTDEEFAATIPSVPPPFSADNPDPLLSALLSVESGVDSAPAAAVTLGDAVFCGSENPALSAYADGVRNIEARRCFFDRYLARDPVVFVHKVWSPEATSVLNVWRAGRDGNVRWFVDSTLDAFGSGDWQEILCGRLSTTIPTYLDVLSLEFRCQPATEESVAEMEKVQGWPDDPRRELPREFRERTVLPSCGYVVLVEDAHEQQAACFQAAVANGAEAELAYVFRDDVRSARWFRVRESGVVEMYEQRIGDDGVESWDLSLCSDLNFGPSGLPQPDSCTVGYTLT